MSLLAGIPPAYRQWIVLSVMAVAGTGLGFAADARWLPRVEYVSNEQQELIEDRLAEIREIDRKINELRTDLKWMTNDARRAANQERILFLEEQKADLERKVGLMRSQA